MIVYAENTDFVADLFRRPTAARVTRQPFLGRALAPLATQLYGDRSFSTSDLPGPRSWSHVFVVDTADRSQFDLLVQAARSESSLPSGVVCLAGSGRGFHGFRNRPWVALAGNIHLSTHLTVPRDAVATVADVVALAAVSVVETIDGIPGLEGRSKIKWVNDVLIDEAKVCGILAHIETRSPGSTSVVIGIGLNVEATPNVPPTPFVPRVAALRAFANLPDRCDRRTVLAALLDSLDRNYRLLLDRGAPALRDRYRQRSLVVGRTVALCAEDSGPDPEVMAEGTVAALGDRLELVLREYPQPFVRGRLILRAAGPRKPVPG